MTDRDPLEWLIGIIGMRKSAVNLSFFLSLATFRMRSSACDTLTRLCVRHVLC